MKKGLGKVNEIEFLRKSVSAVKTRPVNKPASTYNQKLLWFEKVKVFSSSLCEIIVKLPRKVWIDETYLCNSILGADVVGF